MTSSEWKKQPLEEKKRLVQIGLGRVRAGAELAAERMRLNEALDDDDADKTDDDDDEEEEVITTEKRIVTVVHPLPGSITLRKKLPSRKRKRN